MKQIERSTNRDKCDQVLVSRRKSFGVVGLEA